MDMQDMMARGRRIPVRVAGIGPDTTEVEPTGRFAAGSSREPKATVDELVAEGDTDWRDLALRLQAEMVNFRKRQDRRVEEAAHNEKVRLLRRLLPVVDDFDRLVAHKEGPDEEVLRQGVDLTHRELARFLEAEGVNRNTAVGQGFDPAQHDAVATVPSSRPPGTIVEELKPGYRLGDTLLRPAQVVVAGE